MVKKFTKRERILLTLLFAIIFLFLVIDYWLLPSLNQLQELKKEEELLQMQLDEQKFYLSRKEQIKEKIEKLQQETDQLLESIYPAQSSHVYWDFILQKAEETNVEVVHFQEADGNQANVLQGNIRVDAKYHQLVDFIEHLKSAPFAYAIKEGSILKSEDGLTASLSFYFPTFASKGQGQQNINEEPVDSSVLERNPFQN